MEERIVILVDALHSISAGSERQIYRLLQGLRAQGTPVELVLLRHTPFSKSLTDFPCDITSLNITSIASFQAYRTLRKFKRDLKLKNVSVLHAWLPDSCIIAPLLLKSGTTRVMTSRRDMGLIYHGKPAWLFRLLRWRTDAVIANSKAVEKLIMDRENLSPTQTHIIYNGIEEYSNATISGTPIFTGQAQIKLILVANIKPVKRTLDAVNAVIELNKEGVRAELALVGEKQDENYCQKINALIAQSGAESFIHWTGSIDEPRSILNQADIGLLISDSEGLSNAIMEYMQAGLPVVATAVGGNPELIQHNKNGLLVNKGDLNGLKQAISILLTDRALRDSFGATSRARIAQDFSMKNMISRHTELYALSGANSPRELSNA